MVVSFTPHFAVGLLRMASLILRGAFEVGVGKWVKWVAYVSGCLCQYMLE